MPNDYDFSRTSFDEAIAFFRKKTNVPTQVWNDLWAKENEGAFAVAGAMAEDLLRDLRGAVDRAVTEGATRKDFLRDFEDIVGRTGWAYRGGKNWRAGVIWQTNMRSAYRAGQRIRQKDPEILKQRQFLQWLHGGSPRPRPLHLSLHRKVVPADQGDELYRIIGGFGCQCEIVSVSQRDIEREGLVVDDAPKVGTAIAVRGPNGEVNQVRVEADPGWDYLPGDDLIESDAPPLPADTDTADPDAYYRSQAKQIFANQIRDKLDLEPVKSAYAEIERKLADGVLVDEFNAETRRLRAKATELEDSEPGTAKKLRGEAGGRMFLDEPEIVAYLRHAEAERFGESIADRYRRLARAIPDATDPRTAAVARDEAALARLRVEMASEDWRPEDPSWADEYDLDNPKDLAKVKREILAEAEAVRFDRQDVTEAKLAAIQEQIVNHARNL